MLDFWKSLTYTTKFSAIAFAITGVLGVLSMGLSGLVTYFMVFFLFNSYPSINEWHGDWVWPAMIGAGILWPLGFALAGFIWHLLRKHINSLVLLRFLYVVVLWLWAAIIWYMLISSNTEYLR